VRHKNEIQAMIGIPIMKVKLRPEKKKQSRGFTFFHVNPETVRVAFGRLLI